MIFRRNLVSVILVLTVTIFVNHVHTVTFDELHTWQGIVEEEVVEILPDDFEEIKSHIKPPKPNPNKGNRASPPRFKSAECPIPPNFPAEYSLVLDNFRNWSDDLQVSDVWVFQARAPKDVVNLANWAYVYGYKLRAKGFGQSWAPITVTRNSKCSNTILVDTTSHLTQMKMVASKTNADLRAVYVQTGTTMENLLGFLKSHKAALYAAPVSGESTIGGVLATGSHGVGAMRSGMRTPLGYSAGSLSNLILSLKAVVYDHDSQAYVLKKFTRSHEDSRAFLTHIGRAFITEVLLMVGPEYNMRCENRFDLTADRLLASPTHLDSEEGDSLSSLIEKYRSVELTLYPYTERMWTMTCWTTTTTVPASKSRYVEQPYPYTMVDSPTPTFKTLVSRFLSGLYYLSPLISRVEHSLDNLKVRYNQNEDIWGPSSNLQLRYKDAVKRTTSSGYVILTTRSKVQKVASDFYVFYHGLLEKYSADWKFPQNEPMQLTVTGLDNAQDIPGFGKFEPPALSFLAPVDGQRYDTAINVNINSIPGTRHFESFMRELESYLFLKYDGNGALARPEWSKAWGFTDFSAWDNHIVLRKVIPSAFGENWQWAVQRFDYYDPYMVFSNDFLDSFLKSNNSTKDGVINSSWKQVPDQDDDDFIQR